MAQDSASPPAAQPPRQDTDKPSHLSGAEISRLKAKAEGGDAGAQAALGRAYKDGNGVTKNDSLALTWLRKAADQDEPAAENDLGIMYRMGEGVPQDKEEAVRWYKKAARQGNSKAMFNLGASYYNGDGVEIDDVASYAWFLLANEGGNPAGDEALRRADSERQAGLDSALVKVAEMYETGDDLPKNPVQALKWYRKAADAGSASAAVKVAGLLLASSEAPGPAEYAEVRQRCEAAAKQNFSPGTYCMALIYKRGIGTAKDPDEAAKWLGRAAELGYSRAVLELGEAYWKGMGVKPDPVTAYMWIWLAVNSKVPDAERDEQDILKELSPKQVEQAKRKAVEWSNRHRFVGLRQRQAESPTPAK
jgi:uncharacterized protein